MLVLVLILVVIALALVLAAFFLHLVVLAWTSVGISLLAFLVLSYDWWQTRSAVRAGRQAGVGARDDGGDRPISGGAAAGAVGAGAGGAGAVGAYGSGGVADADMEPATQVLPIVPPQSNAAEETIVMPVVAPSGVSEAPSGESRSGGLSSRNVTMITSDDSGSERPGDDGSTAVDPAAGPEPGSGGDPATGTAAPDAGDRAGSDDDAERPAGAGAVVAGAAAGTAAGGAVAAVAGNGRPREAEPSGAGQASARGSGTEQTGADQARSEQTRVTEAGRGQSADPAQAPSGAAPDGARGADGDRATDAGRTTAVTVGAATDLPVEATTQNPAQRAGTQQAGTQQGASQQATTQQAQQPPVQQQAAAQATQQIDTSGEAPEEPRDPTLASLVARLPDEVVVIDERPRYHVQGCPSLPGQPVIPLPVSEAVELGFTPCGWCSPNRALGERHPAEVR